MDLHQPAQNSKIPLPECCYITNVFRLWCLFHVIIKCSSICIFEDEIICAVSNETAVVLDNICRGSFAVPQLSESAALVVEVLSSLRRAIGF